MTSFSILKDQCKIPTDKLQGKNLCILLCNVNYCWPVHSYGWKTLFKIYWKSSNVDKEIAFLCMWYLSYLSAHLTDNILKKDKQVSSMRIM